LGVLNNEDHQERDDRRPSVDNELPSIGIMEYRAGDCPGDDDEYCEQKSNRPPRLVGGSSRDVGEDVLHLSRTRPGETLFPKLPHDTLCRFDSAAPILLGFPLNRWRFRIFDLPASSTTNYWQGGWWHLETVFLRSIFGELAIRGGLFLKFQNFRRPCLWATVKASHAVHPAPLAAK
jgi:hypothetical protein